MLADSCRRLLLTCISPSLHGESWSRHVCKSPSPGHCLVLVLWSFPDKDKCCSIKWLRS